MHVSKEDMEYQRKIDEQEKQESEKSRENLKHAVEEQQKHDKKINQDKIELLRIKQGIDKDTDFELKEHASEQKLKGVKWLQNIWYHYNTYIIMGVLVTGIAIFLLVNVLSTTKADLNVMCFSAQVDLDKQLSLQKFIEDNSNDYNNDDEHYAGMIRINDSTDMANTTKLMAELQASNSMLVIMDKDSEKILDPSTYLVNLKKLFPENKYITDYGFYLKSEKIAKDLDWDGMPKNIYIGIRNPDTIFGDTKETVYKRYEEAMTTLKNIINKYSD